MIAIRHEVAEIEQGKMPKTNNIFSNAPHTAQAILGEKWDRPYTRERAAFPAVWVRQSKFWPTHSRIDNVFGDKNLIAKLQQHHSVEDTPVVANA